MDSYITDPGGIADILCRKYPQPVAKIEKIRLLKGKGIPDWPYWCFMPIPCWMMLFMDKTHIPFTPELWKEIQTFSILGTWRYSKGVIPCIHQC
ncbi:hypothetical protein [Citrobacter telavivensis]